MKRFNFNIKNRRVLFIFLCILLVSIFTLSIAYAALNVVLNVSGNAEVVGSSWDVHFDNIIYAGNSNEPKITNPTSVTFYPVLNFPGDKYFFTVDVVNEGSIDAVIENIIIDSDMTAEQARYLKADVSYASGEAIRYDQVVEKGDFVRLKVSVEYLKDIDSSDLPTSQQVINFSVSFVYSQRNGEGIKVNNNGLIDMDNIISGSYAVGDEVCLSNECFYVLDTIAGDDGSYVDVSLLSKYNLFVGNEVTYYDSELFTEDDESVYNKLNYSVVKQDSRALGLFSNLLDDGTYEFLTPFYGTVAFSDSVYWSGDVLGDDLIFNSGNNIYNYLLDYKAYLTSLGYEINYISIPGADMSEKFSCSTEGCSHDFITSTSYWVAYAFSERWVAGIVKGEGVSFSEYNSQSKLGIRPVITYRVYIDEKNEITRFFFLYLYRSYYLEILLLILLGSILILLN